MNRNNNGLTLVEALVVITILSVLALSLYVVFKSGIDAWSKSETHLEIYQNARVILDQISRELPGAFVGGGAEFKGEDGDLDPIVDGSPDTLVFVTNFAGSIYKIYYELDTDTNILMRGYLENPADLTSIAYETIAFGGTSRYVGISEINFYYWNGGVRGVDGTWNTTTSLPEAVEVQITLQDPAGHTYPFETMVYLPNSG